METELKYELDTLRQTESELQQGRNRINEIRTMVQSETISVGTISKIVSRCTLTREPRNFFFEILKKKVQ